MQVSLSDILLLGDHRLYQNCAEVSPSELSALKTDIAKMGSLVELFRKTYGKGRAIAAPQIGLMKRLIVLNITEPVPIINPVLKDFSKEMMEIWDDCMSFPNLLVKVKRHQTCTLHFKDKHWQNQTWKLEGDFSELLQHEYDHLNGILATQRAVDDRSFRWLQ
jgi:peptide deformylase